MTSTTGAMVFAVGLCHTAKTILHTAKFLSCVTHGKVHTASKHRQRATLPCALSRTLGKDFAVCQI